MYISFVVNNLAKNSILQSDKNQKIYKMRLIFLNSFKILLFSHDTVLLLRMFS